MIVYLTGGNLDCAESASECPDPKIGCLIAFQKRIETIFKKAYALMKKGGKI